MDSYDILVIFLSVALGVFLTLAIIFMIALIRIARRVEEIAEKARATASSVETAARIFQKGAAPAIFARVVANVVETFKEHKSKGDSK